MRLRREGKVTINDIGDQRIYATVIGDNGSYDVRIVKGGSSDQLTPACGASRRESRSLDLQYRTAPRAG
jgi:hypothetical protein